MNNIVKLSAFGCEKVFQINLGKQHETNAGTIIFDCSDWIEKLGVGILKAIHKNSVEQEYPVNLEKQTDENYIWNITEIDTCKFGWGEIQLTYFVDNKKVKTAIFTTFVQPSIGTGTVSPIVIPYVEQLIEIGAEVEANKNLTEQYKNSANESAQVAIEAKESALNSAIRAEAAAESAEHSVLPTAGSSKDDVPTADGQGGWSWKAQKGGIKTVNNKTADSNGNVELTANDIDSYTKSETDDKVTTLNQYVVRELELIDERFNELDIPDSIADLEQDANHRTVTDAEKAVWNGKSNFSGSYNDLTNKPSIPTFISQLIQDETHQTVTQAEKNKWNQGGGGSEYDDTELRKAIQDLGETLTEETAVDEITVNRNENNELQSVGNALVSGGILKEWKGTKAEFNSIGNKSDDTKYIVLDDEETALFEVDGSTIEFSTDNILRIPNNVDLMFQSVLYGNGESGYRKYRNGCIEQWGVAISGANGEVEFNMHQTHIDTNFSVFVTIREKGNFFFYAVPSANQKFALRIQTKDGANMAVKFQWRSWGRWK